MTKSAVSCGFVHICGRNSKLLFLCSDKSALKSEAIVKQNNYFVEFVEYSDPKLRHIVAGHTCPNRPLSDLLYKILKPFILHAKSYVYILKQIFWSLL